MPLTNLLFVNVACTFSYNIESGIETDQLYLFILVSTGKSCLNSYNIEVDRHILLV